MTREKLQAVGRDGLQHDAEVSRSSPASVPSFTPGPRGRKCVVLNRRRFDSEDDFIFIAGPFDTLEAAANNRLVSGDLVCFNGGRFSVVDSPLWLWPWEAEDENACARKAIRHDHPDSYTEAALAESAPEARGEGQPTAGRDGDHNHGSDKK